MTRLVAGIDGGQSSTTALIADVTGRVLARGVAGPADEVGVARDSTRLRDALGGALADACRQAGLAPGTEFTAIVAGVSGYAGRVYGREPNLPVRHLVLTHDAPIAHAGALGGDPGIVVIAGTGSVVYARDGWGAERTLGGWGYLFGDEGSAFGIVRDGLAALMRRADDGSEDTNAAAAACTFFGVGSLRELVRAVYAGEIARNALASFAPAALSLPYFRQFAARGAERLAELVRAAAATLSLPKVSLLGGLFADQLFRADVIRAIRSLVAAAQIVEPKYEAAAGALLLAYREIGAAVPELSL